MEILEKVNEFVNEITIEKLSSIASENKLKVEESFKACVTAILYTLNHKTSAELDTIINVSSNAIEYPENGQNYSAILKAIYGDKLELILLDIAEKTNCKIETIHLVANAAGFTVSRALADLTSSFEVFFVKNLLIENHEYTVQQMPDYLNKKDLEEKAIFEQVLSPLTNQDIYNS